MKTVDEVIAEFLDEMNDDFEAASCDSDEVGVSARSTMNGKNGKLHKVACDRYRRGSRDPANFSKRFYDLVDQGTLEVQRRLNLYK